MITEAIERLEKGEDLDFELVEAIFDSMLDGSVDEKNMADFLVLLSDKGETAEEIAAAVSSLKKHADSLDVGIDSLDTCGTGGDGKNTFNISTASAIVCSLFVPVAKHGNKAVSSKSGSADVLEACGIPINLKKDEAKRYLYKHNFVFLFAPYYHPAMKHVASVRKKLARRTIFNLIGPLANPFNVNRQLVGVFSQGFLTRIFDATWRLGMKNMAVVSSFDGMDEISPSAPTKCYVRRDNVEETFVFDPKELGVSVDFYDIVGFDAKTNAKIMEEVFKGKRERLGDTVALNAGFALFVAGVAEGMEDGFKLAKEAIGSGKALEKFESLSESNGSA